MAQDSNEDGFILKITKVKVLYCCSGLKRGRVLQLPAAPRRQSLANPQVTDLEKEILNLANPQAGQAPQPNKAAQALQAGSLCQPVGGSLCEFSFHFLNMS